MKTKSMRAKLSALLLGLVLLCTAVTPASAQTAPNIVDVVIGISGPSGTDINLNDYDLLREALVATDLAGAVASTNDITVFAPNDRAFLRLANDLGYQGYDEAGALSFLITATGFVSAADPGLLDDVLLYHVVPGAYTVPELRAEDRFPTLLGPVIKVRGNRVLDRDINDRDARLKRPRGAVAANGIIQGVDRVLRPIDLEAMAAPQHSAVEIIVSISGASGTDGNGTDFDLLREALVATELIDAVDAATDVTIFAPTDQAFIRLANDLGYAGSDEAGALGFLITATGFNSAADPGLLDDVLLYHVAPGARTVLELRNAGPIATLGGGTLEVIGQRVDDADPDNTDARIKTPRNVSTSNGTIQGVNQVLRPIDL